MLLVLPVHDHAIPDHQPVRGEFQMLGGKLDEDGPGLRRSLPEQGAERPDGKGAEGAHVPGAEVRVPQDDVHGVQGHVQLLRQHLGEGGDGALAHLHLPGEEGHPAVLPHPEEGVEVRGNAPPLLLDVAGQIHRKPHGEEDRDPAPGQLEEAAAV
jgi:hypothetical protein